MLFPTDNRTIRELVREDPMNRTLLLLLLIPFAWCGCGSSEKKGSSSDDPMASVAGSQAARRAQNDFGDRFSGTVQTAADEIAAATDDWAVRRRTVIWKMRMIKDVRRALQNPFIADAGVDLWILCVQMRQYLEAGDGRTLFGEAQGVAVRAAKRCEEDFVSLGKEVIREEHFGQVKERIEAYAREHPLKPIFVREAFRSKGETKSGSRNRVRVVSNVLNLPIDVVRAPFQAMGGVGDVAGAVREFSVVAANIGETVDVLPEQARWQVELLAYDLENLKAVGAGIESFERFSRSTERIAETAAQIQTTVDNYPDRVRRELTGAVKELDESQTGLQKTLEQTRAAIAALDKAVHSAGGLADSLEKTSSSLAGAGRAWDGAFASFDRMYRYLDPRPEGDAADAKEAAPGTKGGSAQATDDGPAPDSASAIINDIGKSAAKLASAGAELKALTLEVNKLVREPEIGNRLKEVDVTAQAAVDHLAWRVLQVIFAAFAIALGYRFVRVRFVDRRSGPDGKNRAGPEDG